MKSKVLIYWLSGILIILILTEIIARYYGLNQLPLFEESKEFEYIHKPNQDLYVYRNHFQTNNLSMRSKPVENKGKDEVVVLLIGDSIINGGNTLDQDELASTILEEKLSLNLNKKVRVLNISSFTWGSGNIVAYLKKYGTFKADLIVYVTNSGDAYDFMTFDKRVGLEDEKYPAKNNRLAISTLIHKIQGQMQVFFRKPMPDKIVAKSVDLDRGFSQLDSIANSLNKPLIIYVHPDIHEVTNGKYSADGEKIISYFQSKNRKIIKPLGLGIKKEFYRDGIHQKAPGQVFISNLLFNPILQEIK